METASGFFVVPFIAMKRLSSTTSCSTSSDSIEKRVFLLVQKKEKKRRGATRSAMVRSGLPSFHLGSIRLDPVPHRHTHWVMDGVVGTASRPLIGRGTPRITNPLIMLSTVAMAVVRSWQSVRHQLCAADGSTNSSITGNFSPSSLGRRTPRGGPRGSAGVAIDRRRRHLEMAGETKREKENGRSREREREIFCCWLFFSFSLRKVKKKKKKKRPLSAFHLRRRSLQEFQWNTRSSVDDGQ